MRKICVITGSRAEYGLLRWIIQGIKDDPNLVLQVIATGMHLSSEFGLTYKLIEQDGFYIDRKVEILTSSDTEVGIAKSMGLGMIGFADALRELEPDLIVVLGDRFEIFSAVSAALVSRIPVAHLHGGELTEGAYDDAFRHSITKMAHLHFVACETYRHRVIQLGEDPDKVFLVGGLGVDCVKRISLMSKGDLEKSLDFKFAPKNLLVTFHPATLDKISAKFQFDELLGALSTLSDTNLIFTLPNADNGGRYLIKMINEFVCRHANARAFPSLGQLRYLSCLAYVDGVIGNSSSGILEAPSMNKGSINIGDRQKGRLLADSVINCSPNRDDIISALKKLYSEEFKLKLTYVKNPYGNGGASKRVLDVIKDYPLDSLIKKKFHDIKIN